MKDWLIASDYVTSAQAGKHDSLLARHVTSIYLAICAIHIRPLKFTTTLLCPSVIMSSHTERKCAENYNKWHSIFFLNCNQHFGNFKL